MNMRLMSLQIRCKRENYLFHFSDNISFIYGNAGVGKSTLLNLVAFALGGQIIKTHVVSDEVLSVYLTTLLNQSITVIDRKINSNIVHIVYQDKDYYVSAKASHKSGRMSLTEFLCTVCKITPDVLIDKKDNREQSISFSNFMWFAYLRQEELDSNFFYVGDQRSTFRERASLYVLKYLFEEKSIIAQKEMMQTATLMDGIERNKNKLSVACKIISTTNLSGINISEEIQKKRRMLVELYAQRDGLHQILQKEMSIHTVEQLLKIEHKLGIYEAEVQYLKEFRKLNTYMDDLKNTLDWQKMELERCTAAYNEISNDLFDNNIMRMEEIFLNCLREVKFGYIAKDDYVYIDRKTMLPYLCDRNGNRKFDFYRLSSGGKRTIYKITYAFALRLYLAEKQKTSLLPDFLIIDTPMKNISEREDRELHINFYKYVSKLFGEAGTLANVQLIIVDKELSSELDVHKIGIKKLTYEKPLIEYRRGDNNACE